MSTCQQHKHGHDRHDPTMDSCCERELAEQAQARVHLMRLQAVDPSTARFGMAAAVLGTPTVSVSSHEEWDSMEESTEEDAGEASFEEKMQLPICCIAG